MNMTTEGGNQSSLVPYKDTHPEKTDRGKNVGGLRLPFLNREKDYQAEYEELLRAIDRSRDPVETALNGLFRNNGINVQLLEKQKVEAGVKMYPKMEEEHLMPQDLLDFIKHFYGGHKGLHMREIIVERLRRWSAGPGAYDSYEPYILIEVQPAMEDTSELERQSRQVQSPLGNRLGGRIIHLFPKDDQWRASAVVWDNPTIEKEGVPKGDLVVPQMDVDISLIRSIAKMVPIDPQGTVSLGRVISISPIH